MSGSIAACAPPSLSYAPWDVGWAAAVLCALAVGAGVACIGLVGGRLRWTADDRAPLRPLWIALIIAGFTASAAGLYVAFANQAHAHAVAVWVVQSSRACLMIAGRSANLTVNTLPLSLDLGVAALALIALGVGGAVLEWRLGKPRAPR
jgi:hypothetical protein